MKIGDRDIGVSLPVFVIAEIGVNHDGSIERARELVAHAVTAGADAVKVQIFNADRLVHHSAEFAEYQKSRVAAADPAEMLRKYELSEDALKELAAATYEAGLQFIATPFSPENVPTAALLSAAVKIASPDLVNRRLLTDAVTRERPLLVSTGAATAEEISSAVDWLNGKGATFALLHCVSHYPVAEEEANLRWIGELARFGVPVGYSDHATDIDAGALAVACGACVIEKHLTYDASAAGPDHSASLDPTQFRKYVDQIRRAERLLGRGGPRHVLECERDVRRVSRQSLVVRDDLPAGHRLRFADLTSMRPGTGLSAERLDDVIGKPLLRSVRAGEMLTTEDVAGAT